MSFIRLYSCNGQADSAYFLNDGKVFFYASDQDKYAISGKNLVVGATELIMSHFARRPTTRIETALTDGDSTVKRMSMEKFSEGMKSFSFILNVSMVLAKQVLLTNQIINKNLDHLEGDEKKTREYSIQYYMILERIRDEYDKRKMPWLKDVLKVSETNLTFKRGEAYYKAEEPTKLSTSDELSDKLVEYERGTVICEENTMGHEMYILQSGAIDVLINGNRVASIEEAGTVIGEMALLLGEKRTATLRAKNNVVVTKIRKEDLKDVSEKQQDLLVNVSVALAKRHYYNIMKISDINKSITNQALNEEEKGKKPPQAERTLKDLNLLKRKIRESIKGKEASFMQDLIDSF